MLVRRYRSTLEQVRGLRAAIRKKMTDLEEQDAALADQEASLLALCESEERRGDLAELLREEPAAPAGRRRPGTQVIEAILREAGRPLHVTEIVALAAQRGLSFEGKKKPPARICQDKLYGSDRFVLFSRNFWGLPGMTMPEA